MKAEFRRSGEPATVLLVEDNAIVRDSTALLLEHLGYHVLTANNGPEALHQLDHGDRIDLVLSDVVMPGGMTGQELAHAMRQRNPRIAVLLISGYPQDELISSGKVSLGTTVLRKPFPASKLAEALDDVLSAAYC